MKTSSKQLPFPTMQQSRQGESPSVRLESLSAGTTVPTMQRVLLSEPLADVHRYDSCTEINPQNNASFKVKATAFLSADSLCVKIFKIKLYFLIKRWKWPCVFYYLIFPEIPCMPFLVFLSTLSNYKCLNKHLPWQPKELPCVCVCVCVWCVCVCVCGVCVCVCVRVCVCVCVWCVCVCVCVCVCECVVCECVSVCCVCVCVVCVCVVWCVVWWCVVCVRLCVCVYLYI